MNLNHLRWALEVERTGSFTAAAANLFIAQSNLSNGIKTLEEGVGFRIFARKTRGVEATPLGRDFLASARQAVYHLQGLEAAYEKRTFSIAVHRHCGFVARALAGVTRRHGGEGIRFNVRECAEEEILSGIYSGEVMFGIDFCPAENERYLKNALLTYNLSQEIFLESGMYLLMDKDHPLAEKENLTPEDLYDYPMVSFGENESRAVSFTVQARAVGMDLERFSALMLLGDRATLYSYLKESGAIFPTGLVSRHDRERYGLAVRPMGDFVRRYSVITPNGLELPEVCLELIEEIKRVAAGLT